MTSPFYISGTTYHKFATDSFEFLKKIIDKEKTKIVVEPYDHKLDGNCFTAEVQQDSLYICIWLTKHGWEFQAADIKNNKLKLDTERARRLSTTSNFGTFYAAEREFSKNILNYYTKNEPTSDIEKRLVDYVNS